MENREIFNEQLEHRPRRRPWKWILLGLAIVAVAFLVWKFILPVPVIEFAADPEGIIAGDSSTLSWDVSGATAVTIDHGIGSVGPTGTYTVSPTTTTIYSLLASNAIGKYSTATVQVTMVPRINYFTAEPVSITAGESSTLRWSVYGADKITIDEEDVGPIDSRTVSPTTTTTYTLEASNAAGITTATAQVVISEEYLPVIHYFTADPTTIFPGGSSTLSWSVSDATAVSLVSTIYGSLPLTGELTVSPTTTATYTLEASNAKGSITTTVQVVVWEWVPVGVTPALP